MKKTLKFVLIILLAVIALVIGYFIGYRTAYDKTENSSQIINQRTFYAEIKEKNNNSLLVEGLSVNDINFRGEFIISVNEEIQLLWRGEKIELSDLDIGDNISITFDGEVLEIYPCQINKVFEIQLLDDEK